MKVAVTDDWLEVARDCVDWSALESRADVRVFNAPFRSVDEAANTLLDFDVILPMRERLRLERALLERLPNLRMLALTGFQYSHVDMEYCRQRGVTVCGSGLYSPAATAELTLGLILAAQRDLVRADAAVRSGRFQSGLALGHVLEGSVLGIVGLGKIGTRVARYGQAFGMDVIAWSPNLTEARCAEAGVRLVEKDELLAKADIVSLHMQCSASTHGIIDSDALSQMKQGALLVNTARAALVDKDALIAGLNNGRIRAAIDVFDCEPLARDDRLLGVGGTVLSPHLGFSARPGMPLFYRQSIENILAFLDGHPLRELTVPEAQRTT